jgi:small subunit ribosomal protein S16
MLAIRMQRTGRKGHAMFRMVVQDSRRTPTSGKVVAQLGSYDPHAKTMTLDKEKTSFYLEHGAQPSDRVVVILKKEGVKLPKWVIDPAKQEGKVRNPDKRRSTRPEEPAAEEPASEEPAAEEPASEEPAAEETPAAEEAAPEAPAAEQPAEGAPAEEVPAEEPAEPETKAETEQPAE